MIPHPQLSSAMQRAISLAQRGPAQNINPQVGCVILDATGAIVAEGFHAGAGTDHAEVAALAVLDPTLDPGQLTAVVTLEPCNHTGTTPPCADALLASGIGTIVYGQPDRGRISSGGATKLLAHGRTVIGGVESTDTANLLAPWLEGNGAARGAVIAKWAQSLDGRLAAADGTSQWITSAPARQHVHVQRAQADIIVTTTASVAADNPSLTARAADGSLLVPPADQPLPVVFGTGDLDANAALWHHPALAAHGLTGPPRFDGADLARQLEQLAELVGRPPRVFIEAGPRFINALLADGLADELLVYTAPTLLGGPHTVTADLGIPTLAQRHDFRFTAAHLLGPDLVTILRKDT